MGTIVCQTCNGTIEHFEDEKVSVLYALCNHCDSKKEEDELVEF
ncbi:GapA-binding peptide SR1P [Bacillus cihuensis]|nr:GapA-binding peptide SR1P [Bacillus cihuensis]